MKTIWKWYADFCYKHWNVVMKVLIFVMVVAIAFLFILAFSLTQGCSLPPYEEPDTRIIVDVIDADVFADNNISVDNIDDEFANDKNDIAENDEYDIKNETDVVCVPTSEIELCNNLDDNCNGETDEGFDLLKDVFNCGKCENNCFDLPNVQNAICSNGSCASLKCDDGFVNANFVITDGCECELTGEEICDSLDNDCDGAIDEDVPNCCKFGETKDCGLTNEGECEYGKQICLADGSWNPDCVGAIGSTDEICDDKDNNCDGNTDENWSELGNSCSSMGLGECMTVGEIVCAPDEQGAICNAIDNLSSNEICDTKDNDCDGFTDEDLGLAEACEVGKGECKATGVMICDGLGGVTCDAPPGQGPSEEICDGKDNNCDGITDNVDLAKLNLVENCGKCGHSCNTLVGVATAECQASTCVITQCAAKFWDADKLALSGCECQISSNAVEVCDGVDNDCDGTIDENCDSLVMYLPFDGDWNDKSGKGNHATPKNGPVFSADAKMGQSAYFDGLDDYATVADSVTMDSIATEFTFVIAVKPVLFQNGDRVFNKKIGRPAISVEDSKWFFVVGGGDYPTSTPVQTNKWVMIIGRFTNGTLTVFLDGSSILGVNNVSNQAGDILYIGAANFGGSVEGAIRANIDEFQFYNKAWSDSEIANYYQKIQ